MADGYISQIKTPDNKVYLLKDSESIRRNSELLTTNPFAPASLKGPYISKIDNAFYAANKRWQITATNLSYGGVEALFDGNYETQARISGTDAAVITMDFDPEHTNVAEKNKYFPGYPYGYILISFYSPAGPTSISGRVYCNYGAHGIGWHNLTFSPISDNTAYNIVYRSDHQGYYNMAVLEITINGNTSNSYGYTAITQIEMHLDRPNSKSTPFLSKYGDETLYYNLTAPKFIGALQGNADTTTKFNSTRKIELTGAVTGSATTDGSSGWTISTTVNHNHDSIYSYIHLTDYDFTDTQPLSKYVTFDKSRPVGAPKEEWYNGFISSHSNYHASYIINGHTNQNEWYVGHGIWREANTPHATAPTWYLLAHSGNVGTGDNNGQVKIAGQNVSVKGLKALAYKDSLAASDIPDIGDSYLKLSGGAMTGDIKGNASVALGTTANPFHNIVLGGATNATLTADSTNPRITFQESNNGTQPVHLIYSDYDNYRSPAGLKIIGGTSASPAWLEVEGNIYAAAFKGHADSATSANYLYPFSDGTNVPGTTNISILQTIQNNDNIPRSVPFGVKLQHGNTEVGFGYFYPKTALYGGWYIASYGGPSYVAVTNGTWETYWILTSKNTDVGTNNAATLAWNTTYTIAKINGTDIKFTTMAKPSYVFTDLTEHPTTLSGYGITDANIASGVITLGSNTITPVTSVNGHTGSSVDVTAADLGLSNALHFIGITSTTLVDESTTTTLTPKSTGSLSKTTGFVDGDVVMDGDQLREYVWSGDAWRLLGITTSSAYTQPASTATNTWIAQISQGTDGKITATTGSLNTSGTWSGTAAKATSADLTSTANAVAYYTDTTGKFGSRASADGVLYATSANGALQWGTLPIAQGGTGVVSFTKNQVILSDNVNGTTGLISRAYSDSDSAGALSSTSTNFVTERDIYFGLPQINNLHDYTSGYDIYAPTTSGEQYQLLVSNNTNTEKAPGWTHAAWLRSDVDASADVAAYTTLTLGNSTNVTAATAHSEGQIQLYSAATHAHIIKGTSTNTLDYTHILPNSDGVLVQTSSAGAVGGPTQPVYVNADNTITALTFTQNRLYYSASDSSFAATNHYASATQIGLGTITLPQNNTDTLYVNGTTYFVGNVKHNGFAYFANGTTYYIDDTGDARLKNLGIGDAAVSASYALNIEGDTYINGTHFFGNGTTYFIDDDAIGFFPDLRADQIRLNGDQISFYQTENAAGNLYGSIQGIKDYMHFVLSNGTVDTTPTFDFNGHLLPSTDEVGDLGSSTNRWAHLYLGTDDTYGDSYTPIYWNDGVPATVVPVQYCKFTIKESKGVMLTHEAFKENSYVLQIVVTSGESNLNSPIRWASYSSGQLALFCLTPPSGDVSGYILVSRGDSITPESEDFTGIPRPPVDPPTPPPVDPPSPPTPEPEGE